MQSLAGDGFSNSAATPSSWAGEHMAMQSLADETGGKAYFDNNAVGQSAVSAIDDGSNYYTLGYVPTNRKFNGAFRKIAVSLEELGYELSYRRGYNAVDQSAARDLKSRPLSPMAGAMLHGGLPLSQIIFEARVLRAGDPALQGAKPKEGPAGTPDRPLKQPVTRYNVDLSIDPHHLDLTELPNARRQAELEVALALYNADGMRVNHSDTGLQLDLTLDKLSSYMKAGIPIHQEIDVPAGRAYLRVGVRDVTSGRIGTVELGLTR